MANWKSLTDDQLWWKSQPGNRGKDVPSPEEAKAAYGKYGRQANKNVDTVSNVFDNVRKFLFKDSDARKQSVEDAVNARRDAGTSIKLEPYVAPDRDKGISIRGDDDRPRFAPPVRDKRTGAIKLWGEGEEQPTEGIAPYEDVKPVDYDSHGLKKGGKAKAKSKPVKKKLHPNW
jgi:hypothetical protein